MTRYYGVINGKREEEEDLYIVDLKLVLLTSLSFSPNDMRTKEILTELSSVISDA